MSTEEAEHVAETAAEEKVEAVCGGDVVVESTEPAVVEEKAATEEKAAEETTDLEFAGYCPRPRVISRFPYGPHNESHLVELDAAASVRGSVFVEGVSGVGVTSTVVAATLIKQLQLPLVAVFESPHLPQMCSIHSYRATAPFRIYGDSTLCVATGDVPISAAQKSALMWQIVRAFTDFARRHKCTHIVTVEGRPVKGGIEKEFKSIAKLLPKQDGVLSIDTDAADASAETDETETEDEFSVCNYITCDEAVGKRLKAMGHKATRTGQIIGLTGALLQWSHTAPVDDPPVTCLLAPDPVQVPDQRGALLAVKVMRELFALAELDVSELEAETNRLGDKIKKTIADIKGQITAQLQHLQPAPPPSHMYM